MVFKSILIVLVLAIGVTQGAVTPIHHANSLAPGSISLNDAEIQANLEKWLDVIFANVRVEMRKLGLDNININGTRFEFSETVMGAVYYGEASIHPIVLKGLDSIHRTGVAELTTDPNGDIMINIQAGLNDPLLGATMKVKFMGLGPTATISGTLKDIRIRLTVRAKLIPLKALLDVFDIEHLGTLRITVKGLGILGFLIELVGNVLGNLLKDVVGDLLEGPVKTIINNILANPPAIPGSAANSFQGYPAQIPRVFPKVH